jgi:hypothetical protein
VFVSRELADVAHLIDLLAPGAADGALERQLVRRRYPDADPGRRRGATPPVRTARHHSRHAGSRTAGAKALRDKSAAPSAPPPVQPLDIPELTYESDADYRREFHKKHAGDHRDIKLPPTFRPTPQSSCAARSRNTRRLLPTRATRLSKIAPLKAHVDPALLGRAVALACKHMPRLGEAGAKVAEEERNLLFKAGRAVSRPATSRRSARASSSSTSRFFRLACRSNLATRRLVFTGSPELCVLCVELKQNLNPQHTHTNSKFVWK